MRYCYLCKKQFNQAEGKVENNRQGSDICPDCFPAFHRSMLVKASHTHEGIWEKKWYLNRKYDKRGRKK